MKQLRVLLCAATVVGSSWLVPAFAQDFVGKWNSVVKADAMGEMKSVVTISKNEDGEYKVDMGPMVKVNGVYANKNVLTIETTTMEMNIPINLTLTEEDTLEGTISVADMDLVVRATRIKEENTESVEKAG